MPRLCGIDVSAYDPRVLAHLPYSGEPVLFEKLNRRAEQETALGFTADGRFGYRLDQAAALGGDLRERALEPGSGDPLAAVPLVDEYAGDPPAGRRRRILAVLTVVLEPKPVGAAVLAPALRDPLLIEDQRRVRLARWW